MSKLKACIIIALLARPTGAGAFLSVVAETAKDAAEAAAVVGASTELLNEVTDNADEANAANAKLRKANEDFQSKVREAKYLSNEAKALYLGPNHSSRQLEQNIKNTTQYVKRAKRLLLRVGILSPAASTAVNTAETNSQLTEVQKNQQAQILTQQEHLNYTRNKDIQTQYDWNQFIARQRAIRNGNTDK